jgi:hypothetical protein
MVNEDDQGGLSPTVLQVLEHFVTAMRADERIEGYAIDRFEKLLRQGAVPKPDEIYAALFDPQASGD